jgi:UDP-N-acetylmuramoyl-tripeptide--D-alanyl-D-alanine ligase
MLSIPATAAPIITAVCTDSRRIEPNSLFFALRGDKFDGHAFCGPVADKGAIAAVVDQAPHNAPESLQLIQVSDTRKALGKLGQFVRMQFTGRVVAVAGSNGKTGTKHLIDAALHDTLRGSISPKSFNNDIGVPVTIFAAKADDDYLVLEIGTNHHGEIAPLAAIAAPDIAVITNCSEEHLEGLTDLDGVRRENARMIDGLSPSGLLVVNGDDPLLLDAVGHWRGMRVTFGFSESNDLWAGNVRCGLSGTQFTLNGGAEAFVPLLGRHTAANCLAAVAVGRAMGVCDEAILAGLSQASGPEMRLQLKTIGGITVVNDAYNANPASMRAALETLRSLRTNGRRVAVLGEMRELGLWAEQYHREIGRLAATCGLDGLVCVGACAGWIAEEAVAAGMPHQVVSHYTDAAAAGEAVSRWIREGDLILLKASRAVGLETITKSIGAARRFSAAG